MDNLPPQLIGILTPAMLLGLAVWMLLTGRLWTGRAVDKLTAQWESEKRALIDQHASEKRDLIRQSDNRVAEAHEGGRYWREAHHTSEEIRANVAAQMETLRLNSELAVRVLASLPGASRAAIDGAKASEGASHDD
jgi:hypothetical protein